MSSLSREAFARLMAQVENLEDVLEQREAELKAATATGDADRISVAETELDAAREALRGRREELARLSDGCGHGHHQR